MQIAKTKCTCFENLLKQKTTPALFIGAGFSKRYLINYPDWLGLLKKIADAIGMDTFIISKKYDELINEGKTKSDACFRITSIIEKELNKKIDSGKANEIFSLDEKYIIETSHLRPIKYLAAKHFNQPLQYIFDVPYLKRELNLFKKLQNNVPCIFTTNYDTLIENLFLDYKCFKSQSDYFYNDNTDYMEIYKLHGSAEEPNTLILTEDDYTEFDRKNYLSVSKFINILSERPIIFMGYSLSDPNIIKILNQITDCLNSEQLRKLEKNIIIIEREEHKRSLHSGSKIIPLPNSDKGLRITFITTDNFIQIFWYLNQFKPTARPSEIRKYKLQIKHLIETNDSNLKTYITKADTLDKLTDEVAITELATPEEAYSKYPPDALLKDALFDTNKFTPISIIDAWFMHQVSTSQNVPLYYYLKQIDFSNLPPLKNDLDKIKERLDSFHRNKRKTYEVLFKSIESATSERTLEKFIEKEQKLSKKILKLAKAYYIDNYLNIKEYRKKLQELYNLDNSLINLQEMKKAIVLIDYDARLNI